MPINVRDYLGGTSIPDPYGSAQSEEELLRQQQLERERYLGRISGRAPTYRQRELENLRLAGKYASAGDFLTPGDTVFDIADTATSAWQREQDTLDKVDKLRAQNVDSDSDRVRQFVRNAIGDQQNKDTLEMRKSEHELTKERLGFDIEKSKADLDMRQKEFGMRGEEFELRKRKMELDVEKQEAAAKGLTWVQGLKTADGRNVYTNKRGVPVDIDGNLLSRSQLQKDTSLDVSSSGRIQYGDTFRGSDGNLYTQIRETSAGGGQRYVDRNGKDVPPGVTLRREVDVGAETKSRGKELGKAEAEAENKMVAESRGAHTTKQNIRDIRGSLKDIWGGTGPLTENWLTKGAAGAIEQVTGWDPLQIKDRQTAQAGIKQMVLARRATMKGQGTITNQENEMIDAQLPNLGHSDEANKQIMDILEKGADRAIQKERDWRKAQSENPGLSYNLWDYQWRVNLEKNEGRTESPSSKAGTSRQPMPSVGDTRGGYRYKGGDPNDQNSWEKM